MPIGGLRKNSVLENVSIIKLPLEWNNIPIIIALKIIRKFDFFKSKFVLWPTTIPVRRWPLTVLLVLTGKSGKLRNKK